jgi:SAM-dependent methyltransferase
MPSDLSGPVREFVAALPSEALVLEVGSGMGAFDRIAPGYVALDLSLHALRTFSSGPRIQANAERLPFADRAVDAVFTIASLEHVPNPDRALAEIDRVLRPGGRALVYPAWYVRPWAAKALHRRPLRELRGWDRLRKLSIPLRDRREYQFLRCVPGRVGRELRLLGGGPQPFRFGRLEPNLERYVTSDSDAFTSMDPHAASVFFRSRGYRDLGRPSPRRAVLYGYEAVVVEKPDRPGI